jgi:hypothetical protein
VSGAIGKMACGCYTRTYFPSTTQKLGAARVNTFHAFSFSEKRWSPVLPSSNASRAPSPRDRHVAFAFGNSFYVHGGVSDAILFRIVPTQISLTHLLLL